MPTAVPPKVDWGSAFCFGFKVFQSIIIERRHSRIDILAASQQTTHSSRSTTADPEAGRSRSRSRSSHAIDSVAVVKVMPVAGEKEDTDIYKHQHYSHRAPWLRAFVLGANDGLVSVAALMVGVGGGDSNLATMRLAGIAAWIAGAMSMAVGEYISVASQRDAQLADVEKERQQQAKVRAPCSSIQHAHAWRRGRSIGHWPIACMRALWELGTAHACRHNNWWLLFLPSLLAMKWGRVHRSPDRWPGARVKHTCRRHMCSHLGKRGGCAACNPLRPLSSAAPNAARLSHHQRPGARGTACAASLACWHCPFAHCHSPPPTHTHTCRARVRKRMSWRS